MEEAKTRAYLSSRVMPAVFAALCRLDAARPQRPLLFLAKEFEAASGGAAAIAPASATGAPPGDLWGGDTFANVNGVVRDELLEALRHVGRTRPREPLRV